VDRVSIIGAHEDDLIARSASGDTEAADRLLERYKDDAYNIIRRMVNDNDMADDILVEVLTEIYQSLAKFKGGSSFRTWLYRVTVNVTLEYIRRNRQPVKLVSIDNVADPEVDVAQVVVKKAQAAAIESAIRALPHKMRAVLSLYYLGECTCSEIAQILKIPLGTVKSRLFTGTHQIKSKLQERGHL